MRTMLARWLEKLVQARRFKRAKELERAHRDLRVYLLSTEMKKDGLEVHADKVSVVCVTCGGYCGQCGSGNLMSDYERKLKLIEHEHRTRMDRLYDQYA